LWAVALFYLILSQRVKPIGAESSDSLSERSVCALSLEKEKNLKQKIDVDLF